MTTKQVIINRSSSLLFTFGPSSLPVPFRPTPNPLSKGPAVPHAARLAVSTQIFSKTLKTHTFSFLNQRGSLLVYWPQIWKFWALRSALLDQGPFQSGIKALGWFPPLMISSCCSEMANLQVRQNFLNRWFWGVMRLEILWADLGRASRLRVFSVDFLKLDKNLEIFNGIFVL